MKMQARLIKPDGNEEQLSIEYHDGILGELSKKYFDDSTLDLTRVKYKGRLCHMAVDDNGHLKGLPYNKAATKLYLDNCYPGTSHMIVGPAVVFDGLLP